MVPASLTSASVAMAAALFPPCPRPSLGHVGGTAQHPEVAAGGCPRLGARGGRGRAAAAAAPVLPVLVPGPCQPVSAQQRWERRGSRYGDGPPRDLSAPQRGGSSEGPGGR